MKLANVELLAENLIGWDAIFADLNDEQKLSSIVQKKSIQR